MEEKLWESQTAEAAEARLTPDLQTPSRRRRASSHEPTLRKRSRGASSYPPPRSYRHSTFIPSSARPSCPLRGPSNEKYQMMRCRVTRHQIHRSTPLSPSSCRTALPWLLLRTLPRPAALGLQTHQPRLSLREEARSSSESRPRPRVFLQLWTAGEEEEEEMTSKAMAVEVVRVRQ